MMYGIDLIERIVYRNTLKRVLTGVVIIILGCLTFLLTTGLPDQTILLFQALGLAIILAGGYLLVSGLRKLNVSLDHLVITLRNNPRDIVWFYSYMVINMPYGVRVLRMATIFLYSIDGHKITLSVKEKELKSVMKTLEKYLPHASNGYTVVREQLYKANPALLYCD